MDTTITIQFRVWKNGRPGAVKEKTFAGETELCRWCERSAADIEVLRYSR